jgi:hypothetical protein
MVFARANKLTEANDIGTKIAASFLLSAMAPLDRAAEG